MRLARQRSIRRPMPGANCTSGMLCGHSLRGLCSIATLTAFTAGLFGLPFDLKPVRSAKQVSGGQWQARDALTLTNLVSHDSSCACSTPTHAAGNCCCSEPEPNRQTEGCCSTETVERPRVDTEKPPRRERVVAELSCPCGGDSVSVVLTHAEPRLAGTTASVIGAASPRQHVNPFTLHLREHDTAPETPPPRSSVL